jgi:hypothetical protein
MGRIYSLSKQTLIWIGESSKLIDEESGLPLSTLGLEYLTRSAEQIREARRGGLNPVESPLFLEARQQGKSYIPGGDIASPWLLGLMEVLFMRRWWSQVWVLQEAAIAGSAVLICGAASADFDDVNTLARNFLADDHELGVHGYFDEQVLKRVVPHCLARYSITSFSVPGSYQLSKDDGLYRLETAFHSTNRSDTSDAREKVFGL